MARGSLGEAGLEVAGEREAGWFVSGERSVDSVTRSKVVEKVTEKADSHGIRSIGTKNIGM